MTGEGAQDIGRMLRSITSIAPDAPAFVAPDISVTREQLLTVCERYARRMAAEGVRKGDTVSIDTMDGFASIVCCFALALLGATYLPYSRDLLQPDAPQVDHFLRDVARPPTPGLNEVTIDGSWFQPAGVEDVAFPGFDDDTATCWISPSSGTTGSAKYAAISVRLLASRLQAVALDYIESPTRLMVLFHGGSRPFIIRAVAALVYGHVVIDIAPHAFALAKGVTTICASPLQIEGWLKGAVLSPRIPLLQVSGAKLPLAQIETLLQSFDRVEDVYGSNETIKCSVTSWTLGCGGVESQSRRVKGAEVQIVDAANNPLPNGETGRVRLKTDYMISGYLDAPNATAEHFHDGWFYPGDLGCLTTDGRLKIFGREGELVNIGGHKFLLSEIDEALAAASSVRRASCFKLDEKDGKVRLAACLEIDGTMAATTVVPAARQLCADRFGTHAAPSVLLIVPILDVTADGVTIRKEAEARFHRRLRTADKQTLHDTLFVYKAT